MFFSSTSFPFLIITYLPTWKICYNKPSPIWCNPPLKKRKKTNVQGGQYRSIGGCGGGERGGTLLDNV